MFERVIDVHESHPEVRGLLGTKVLMFRSKSSLQKLSVYPGPLNMVSLPGTIAVAAADFHELWVGLVRGASTLEVKSAMFQWGTARLFGEAIPMVYRHLFDGPLEDFAEPTAQWRRAEEQRQRDALAREEAKRRADAELREARMRAQAERERRDAEVQAQQQAALARQRAASQPKPTSSRIVHRSLPSTTRRDDEDSLADFMFMSMFPDVAPLYRPNSFLAWYLWSQQQGNDGAQAQPFTGAGGQFDGGGASGDWGQGVPGFPDAVSQRVTERGDSQRVELLDANGRSVGSFIVTENNGQTQFTAPGGHVFTVADQGKPTIEYASDSGQRFSWDGVSEPVVESAQDNGTMSSSYSSSTFGTLNSFNTSNDFVESGSSPSNSTDSSGYSNTRDEPQSMDSATAY